MTGPKACPFCGSTSVAMIEQTTIEWRRWKGTGAKEIKHWPRCTGCGHEGLASDDKSQALIWWNTRAGEQ